MSFINTSTIDDIAHSLDISKLSHEAAKALAPDTEYRMRELIQPLYGFSNKDPAKYIKAAGHPDLYCLQDKELSIEQLRGQLTFRTKIHITAAKIRMTADTAMALPCAAAPLMLPCQCTLSTASA
ncbi:hypothetical protein DUNSADRAFT_4254 [Dunaliella salina]|uniref:TATA box binding protein associated factor (TAF) histone-like fold domain-containing protein n=1 Tax=Dunaliella salina TaxID=3046 RepID=A0ABQ7GSC0_DUNSA|nr:hypothetical protein DUNSADRAFT_4254 [Dunaliella salina]|eukprot:KAF5837507.1 hypothetical protein DUNSADRAFT_4254 [Dunaliella salina]